jgi:hypothetical protein
MAIAGDGGVRVDTPPCRPAQFGLRAVADVQEGSGDWVRGLEWDELDCTYDVGIVSAQCPALPEQHKHWETGYGTSHSDPFAVYAGWGCSTMGETAGAWDKAHALLEQNLWKGLEFALWLGKDQDNNNIAGSFRDMDITDVTPAGGAVGITEGVALLEDAYGRCSGCEGIIHMPRGVSVYASPLIEIVDSRPIIKATGTRVAAGAGYPYLSPDGAIPAEGNAWIIITGTVSVRLGYEFFLPERGDLAGAVVQSTNDIRVYAERAAAFQVACCSFMVQVTLTTS